MNTKKLLFAGMCLTWLCAGIARAQQNPNDRSDTISMEFSFDPVRIEATRAHERVPVTYTELGKEDIQPLNTGQDIPYILRFTPSLVVTSDAGNGIGYTGLWIRGSDPSRVNISINGIPLNDPESQQVFWVNTPDLSSAAGSIQIQRGVGTSSNGAAAFGGLIKIETTDRNERAYSQVDNAFGSFNARKHSVQVGTGLLNNRFILEGRFSRIASDGYIDRARADLFGYEITGTVLGKKSELLITAFGGREETYQSWYGTPAEIVEGGDANALLAFAGRNGFTEAQTSNLLNSGRTYNFYTYDNQIDSYGQDHFQVHWKSRLSDELAVNVSGHYTRGQGYFEEFREQDSRTAYGLAPLVTPSGQDTIDVTDLIRQRWLDNHFYGTVFSVVRSFDSNLLTVGGAMNEYRGDHFGELIWLQWAGDAEKDQRYYEGSSLKRDANMYVRYIHNFKKGWDAYGDVQVRAVSYRTKGVDNDLRAYDITDDLLFFNPKVGVTKRLNNKGRVYASVAAGSKEPNRNDYVDAPRGVMPRPEYMTDVEAGFEYEFSKKAELPLAFSANLFWMIYRDQLVLTGELNDVGAPLRVNVPESFRAGIEMEARAGIIRGLTAVGNLTLAEHRIVQFDEVLYDYTSGFDVVIIEHSNTPIAFSPRVVGAAGIVAQFGERKTKAREDGSGNRSWWEVSWMQKYVGKQYLDNTGNEMLTIDAYTTGDALASYVMKFGMDRECRVNVWVNNALNAGFVSNGYTFSYIFGERITERFYYPQAGRNYMVGLNLRF
ncbi:MAG: TonB-dependent receptor [Flavobacteriales bacterium]